jgi:hypothetical protein
VLVTGSAIGGIRETQEMLNFCSKHNIACDVELVPIQTPSVRLYNYFKKIGTNEDKMESFIVNFASSPEPDKIIDVAHQVAQLSRSESIPLEGPCQTKGGSKAKA